jgi:hypothetical protein
VVQDLAGKLDVGQADLATATERAVDKRIFELSGTRKPHRSTRFPCLLRYRAQSLSDHPALLEEPEESANLEAPSTE